MRTSTPVPDRALFHRPKAVATRAGALFPIRVVRRFFEDDAPSLAVFIAWNALTAVFPIVLILIAVGGAVLSLAGIPAETVTKTVVAVFPSDAGAQDVALTAIDGVRRRTGIFAIVAVFGFLWSASLLFGAIELTFKTVFRMPGRPFIKQKLMALLMMALFVVLGLLAVGTSAVPALLKEDVPGIPISTTDGLAGNVIQFVIGAASAFVLFLAIYVVVPTRRHRLRCILPGALFGGVAFEALSQLFPLYIRVNPGINQYGRDFALLFVLLAFSYFLGVITLIGAEIIAVLETPEDRGSRSAA